MKTGRQPLEGRAARFPYGPWKGPGSFIHLVCEDCQRFSWEVEPQSMSPQWSAPAQSSGLKQIQALTPTVNLARGTHAVGTRLSCL